MSWMKMKKQRSISVLILMVRYECRRLCGEVLLPQPPINYWTMNIVQLDMTGWFHQFIQFHIINYIFCMLMLNDSLHLKSHSKLPSELLMRFSQLVPIQNQAMQNIELLYTIMLQCFKLLYSGCYWVLLS